MDSAQTPWFHCRMPRPQAHVRLLCFPHAGGATTVFHAWPDRLPADVEVHALRLPGRESRQNEPLLSNMDQLVGELVPVLRRLGDRPIALFGFSLGALVAFEVAHRLEQETPRSVCHLFVAAQRAPQICHSESIHQLPDGAFLRLVQQKYGALPRAIRDNPELVEFFLPVIRADMTMLETYQYRRVAPLDCPITVYGGTADPSTTLEQLSAWRIQTAKPVEVKMLPGDHFFPQSARDELLRDLSTRLASCPTWRSPTA